MSRKYSLLLLVLFITGLYVILNKAIVPFVTKVAESELFFEKDAEPDELLGKVQTERTGYGLVHCKAAVRESEDLGDTAVFHDEAYEAWALGNRTYIIRSSVLVTPGDEKPRAFACKMKFNGEDASVASNWSVMGIDYNLAD